MIVRRDSAHARGRLTLAASGALAVLLAAPASAAPMVVNFDDLPAAGNFVAGNRPSDAARLSDGLVRTHGVAFRSGGGHVAVVRLNVVGSPEGPHAVSGANGIAGTAADGTLTYAGDPMFTATFFNPADPTQRAVTNYVSVRGDRWATGEGKIGLRAYDRKGRLLAASSTEATAGAILGVYAPGIHRVEVSGNGSTAFDNFAFNPVATEIPALEPPSAPDGAAAFLVAPLPLAVASVRARGRRQRRRAEAS